jgi:hypothetical protein
MGELCSTPGEKRHNITMKITMEFLNRARTNAGGFTRAQTDLLGIPWPLPANWLRNLVGTEIDIDTANAFYAARDIRRCKVKNRIRFATQPSDAERKMREHFGWTK